MFKFREKAQTIGTLEYYEDVSLEDLQRVIQLHPPKSDAYGTFFRLPRSLSSGIKYRPRFMYAARSRSR